MNPEQPFHHDPSLVTPASAPPRLTEIPAGVEIRVLPPPPERSAERNRGVLVIICQVCNIGLEELYGRQRGGIVATARSMACWILSDRFNLTEDEIARALKDPDSASLIHNRAYDFRGRIKRNQNVKALYESAMALIDPAPAAEK